MSPASPNIDDVGQGSCPISWFDRLTMSVYSLVSLVSFVSLRFSSYIILNCSASATCSAWTSSSPARSAIVRATFRTRS
jgi:hypothetical protein